MVLFLQDSVMWFLKHAASLRLSIPITWQKERKKTRERFGAFTQQGLHDLLEMLHLPLGGKKVRGREYECFAKRLQEPHDRALYWKEYAWLLGFVSSSLGCQ